MLKEGSSNIIIIKITIIIIVIIVIIVVIIAMIITTTTVIIYFWNNWNRFPPNIYKSTQINSNVGFEDRKNQSTYHRTSQCRLEINELMTTSLGM